jgi:flagellar M-ring protein FliF
MDRLSEYMKKIFEKFKALSSGRKIAYGIILLGVIVSVILFSTIVNNNKYGVLFKNLSAIDGKNVTDTLTKDKVDFNVSTDGSTIYVPTSQVGTLRLSLAPGLNNGSVGYELFDTSNPMGETDQQLAIEKLRANQGELERTIKSFPQVENARVHIAQQDESAFMQPDQAGKVSVYLTLKYGTTLTNENVKAIMALVSGALDNVPVENVSIIDQDLKLLSADVNNPDASVAVNNQQDMETMFQTKLEKAASDILEPALGANNFEVKVNVDMNFDSKERTVITYDPNKVLVSGQFTTEGNLGNVSNISQSPVDNNMTNFSITTQGAVNTGITKVDNIVNYNNGSTKEVTEVAPGQVTRMTASVIYNGTLTDADKAQIQAAVSNAIGFKPDRGDSISVVGMKFDPTKAKEAEAQIAALKAQTENEAKMQMIKTIAIGAGIFLVLLVGLIMFLVSRRKQRRLMPKSIDVVVGDSLYDKNATPYVPLDLDHENESDHISNDIKKYAEEKPDQVVDIIKSWLAEDER